MRISRLCWPRRRSCRSLQLPLQVHDKWAVSQNYHNAGVLPPSYWANQSKEWETNIDPDEKKGPKRLNGVPSSLGRPVNRTADAAKAATDVLPADKHTESHQPEVEDNPTDHRDLGTRFSLFIGDPASPGSPFFHPDGAHIFHKLQAFLRAQYPSFGIREVITPNLYKEALWRQSGHWNNYKTAMFAVKGRSGAGESEDPNYSLKPMNCPGHCLLFKSQKHSFRELPIRYADFSPLHRNEVSGSLSGLTRVRRFHQDDGHIFCKPDQVEAEIKSTLSFVELAYSTLSVGPYKLVLSTRPEQGFLGQAEQWEEAERQLTDALNVSDRPWELNAGEGAFYGPKIDVVIKDHNQKEHQTATIQLDFQLPQRFGLEYDVAPKQTGTPVLIHRAILGSIERFMALLIEKYRGHWPFWLSPRQVVILTVGDEPEVVEYAEKLRRMLALPMRNLDSDKPYPASSQIYKIDIDSRNETLAKKIVGAKTNKYNLICFVGKRNVRENDIDVDVTGQPHQARTLEIFRPLNRETVEIRHGAPAFKMAPPKLQRAMEILSNEYL